MTKKHSLVILVILLVAIGVFLCVKNINLPSENLPEGEQGDLQESQLDRQEIMEDVAGKISDISPVKPVLGGSWYIDRFWFIKDSDENFYVEYEDGHISRQILLSVEKKEDKLNYKVIGYFEPGETTWVLKKGEDSFFGKGLDLYERDEESGRWIRKN